MLFELDADQRSIADTVDRILAAHAGPARARALGGVVPTYDHELAGVLEAQGFLGFRFGEGAGPLEAAILVQSVARAAGVVAAAAEALVVPGALPEESLTGPVALCVGGATGPVRFASDASTLIVLGDHEVSVVDLSPDDVHPVGARYGYPMGHVARVDGRVLPDGAAARVRNWWRVALANEISGTVRAAIDLTTSYLRERHQFGRPIGSFQGVQHRMAECEVLAQGAGWLALESAWSGADAQRAAAALTAALRAAERAFADTHQFSGALGFTEEYDLHLWTMRLPALRAEAHSLGSPATALSTARWASRGR